jgi:hypothetical protein
MKTISSSRGLCVMLLAISTLGSRLAAAQMRSIEPVLAFPEAGIDDPAAYQGYQTRFFRDAAGNVVQVYLDARSGRVVTVLADAVNESVGFTVRDVAGKPRSLTWGSERAVISRTGGRRSIEYELAADDSVIQIGWILLGSMRVERDLGYSGRQLEPFSYPTFHVREVEEMISNLERLSPVERSRHLRLLNASGIPELRRRLVPVLRRTASGLSVSQPSIDGRTHLQLDFGFDPRKVTFRFSDTTISVRAKARRTIRFSVRITTDAPSLTRLARDRIFNQAFLRFLDSARLASDRAKSRGARLTGADSSAVTRFRLLERDVRGVELLSSQEKLMAGMPNYATYFGRDMMMTALMMQPIWSGTMAEHVIASVLRKLGPMGDVSHEEALGGQAIRENAAEYNRRIGEYLRASQGGDRARSDSALSQARAILVNLQKVRENYNMRDDEFQLPVITARYLTNASVPAERKIAFLVANPDGKGRRLDLLLKELGLVTSLAAPYARDPVVTNLVGAPRADSTHWRPVSWRDSGAGYANGRFAMDINAIWVPSALESIGEILEVLRSFGWAQTVTGALGGGSDTTLTRFANNRESLRRAVQTWKGAARHFVVSLSADEIRAAVPKKLASLPADEAEYWRRVVASSGADRQPLEFLAISLDADGRPVQVVNTDPATWLFLEHGVDSTDAMRDRAIRDVRALMREYPVGLFVNGLGTIVANDAYAPPTVWEAFRRDTYHSPRVVWGREMNLIMLGLAKQISAAVETSGRPRTAGLAPYVLELRDALRATTRAVEASGLEHNELWSYEISNGRLVPIRYGASTDIQLWNVTTLAVQFVLSRLPRE